MHWEKDVYRLPLESRRKGYYPVEYIENNAVDKCRTVEFLCRTELLLGRCNPLHVGMHKRIYMKIKYAQHNVLENFSLLFFSDLECFAASCGCAFLVTYKSSMKIKLHPW